MLTFLCRLFLSVYIFYHQSLVDIYDIHVFYILFWTKSIHVGGCNSIITFKFKNKNIILLLSMYIPISQSLRKLFKITVVTILILQRDYTLCTRTACLTWTLSKQHLLTQLYHRENCNRTWTLAIGHPIVLSTWNVVTCFEMQNKTIIRILCVVLTANFTT